MKFSVNSLVRHPSIVRLSVIFEVFSVQRHNILCMASCILRRMYRTWYLEEIRSDL